MLISKDLSLFALASLAFGGVLAGCTLNPTVEDVVEESAPVICNKMKECSDDVVFSMAYPGGVDECVSKTKSEASKKYGGDLDKRSTCTDEELDKCLQDFKATACPKDGSLPKVPCDC